MSTSNVWKDVWKVLAPKIGTIAVFAIGSCTGGLLMSKNFTVQKGDFQFSTQDNRHALELLRSNYKDRVNHLKIKSSGFLKDFEDDKLTEDSKRDIVKKTIDYYLTPTSHDKLFSTDVVLFNGKGKPTIVFRTDFDDIKDNWSKVLSLAGVKKCVDEHRIGEDYSLYQRETAESACKACMQKFSPAAKKGK